MANVTDEAAVKLKLERAKQFKDGMRDGGKSVRKFGKDVSFAKTAARNFTSGLASLGRGMAYTTAAAAGLAVVLGKRSYDAYTETYKVGRQTNAVIKSTGGVANVTAAHVDALATAVSRKTGIDDEQIAKSENLLLTFKQVRNEVGRGNKVFDRATRAAIDLSAAGFGSTSSAAKMLGKALNDPVKGITAMNRAGVTFTEDQKKQIKSLVENGNALKAQRIILREVESQVKGSAAAQATPTEKMRVAWENVEEALGKVEHRFIDRLAPGVTKFLIGMEPKVLHFGNALDHAFSDKNLSLGEKLKKAQRSAKHWFGPVVDDAKAELKKLDVAGTVGPVIDKAGPVIGDHLAHAAVVGARAFIRAWWDMGIGGKLFTAALLAGKLGAFSSLGSLAAGKFAGSFKTSFGPAMNKAGMGKTMTSLGGKWGGVFGRAFALTAAAPIVADVWSNHIEGVASSPAELAFEARARAQQERHRDLRDALPTSPKPKGTRRLPETVSRPGRGDAVVPRVEVTSRIYLDSTEIGHRMMKKARNKARRRR